LIFLSQIEIYPLFQRLFADCFEFPKARHKIWQDYVLKFESPGQMPLVFTSPRARVKKCVTLNHSPMIPGLSR
jgi:hypothetical protein